jgi:ribosomal protein S14
MAHGSQTWRMLRLPAGAAQPCGHCGQVHEYLRRPAHGGLCRPVVFPPGYDPGGRPGVEVEVFPAGPLLSSAAPRRETPYELIARRVAAHAIRCEHCGERFTDLGAYAEHPCEIRYR